MLSIDATIAPEPETQLTTSVGSYPSPNTLIGRQSLRQSRQDFQLSGLMLADVFEKDCYESHNTVPTRKIVALGGGRVMLASTSEAFITHVDELASISSTESGAMYLWPGHQVVHQIIPSDHNMVTIWDGGAIGKLEQVDQGLSWTPIGLTNIRLSPPDTFSDTVAPYAEGSSVSMATLVMQGSKIVSLHKLTEHRRPKPADLITDLNAALEDLDSVSDEAIEDGYPEPTPQAIDSARLLIKVMYDIRPMRYDIYPMDDGEVVIDGGSERRIGVFCYSDGSVLYIGWVGDKRVRIRRDSPDDIPYEFLNLALHQLGDA